MAEEGLVHVGVFSLSFVCVSGTVQELDCRAARLLESSGPVEGQDVMGS